jgi:tRNA-2-methylthio-N6-dimethylallyladenosine synthase
MNFFIKTYGCQMNTYESRQLKEKLLGLGLPEAKTLAGADLFIINSCSVRQAAEDSVYGLGKVIKSLARKPVVILTGCLTGVAKSTRRRYEVSYLQKKAPFVDYFLTNEELLASLPEIVLSSRTLIRDPGKTFSGDSGFRVKTGTVRFPVKPGMTKEKGEYVPISYGCNNFCSYCIVPYARGPEHSRPFGEIRKEVKELISRGTTEIMLLGQNVNSWEGVSSAPRFSDLLRAVHNLPGLTKLSFMSSNPWDFSDDLVNTLKLPKIDRYLHLPVQSGDDAVLKRMNRHYTAEDYLALVSKIRQAVPKIRIGTDIIVGFPGETEEEFKNTLDLVNKVGFKQVFVAMYSPRKGTVAAETMIDSVPKNVKRQRHNKILKLCKPK